MQPSSFLSNADNLFKFLFLNGIIFILLGMFYPLEQRNNLELKILEYNKKVALMHQENKILDRDIKELDKAVDLRIKKSSDLVRRRGKIASNSAKQAFQNQIDNIKSKTNTSFLNIQKKSDEISKNIITIENEKKVIEQLIEQKKVYDSYWWWFFTIGLCSGIVGFIFWLISTIISEVKNYKEMRNL